MESKIGTYILRVQQKKSNTMFCVEPYDEFQEVYFCKL